MKIILIIIGYAAFWVVCFQLAHFYLMITRLLVLHRMIPFINWGIWIISRCLWFGHKNGIRCKFQNGPIVPIMAPGGSWCPHSAWWYMILWPIWFFFMTDMILWPIMAPDGSWCPHSAWWYMILWPVLPDTHRLVNEGGPMTLGTPDSKVHGDNMGPIWGKEDPGGPHAGPMNLAIWGALHKETTSTLSDST